MSKPTLGRIDQGDPADQAHLGGPDVSFRLHLDDLIPGTSGEIVLFNDSALLDVVIEAPAKPTEVGLADGHVTAEGVDVDGYCYLQFAIGVVVFHDPDTRVIVDVVIS